MRCWIARRLRCGRAQVAAWRFRFLQVVVMAGMLAHPRHAHGQSLTLSGGADARFTHQSAPADNSMELTGLFLNLRKVWSDDAGDRWIGVGQVDFDHNFQDVRPYQVYLQYKGPLGKWNLRAGHFLLPFGLLATYDTERLVLKGMEEASLGIRKDTGIQALGHFGRWDYALALTLGVGDRRLLPLDQSRLLSGWLAYIADNGQVGLSVLAGRLLPDGGGEAGSVRDEWRLGADATKSLGRLTLRAEVVGGTTEGRAVGGAIVLADYALRPKLELNTRAAYWREEREPYAAGIGLTYRPWSRLYLRVADSQAFGERDSNAFTAQVYFEFSRAF